MLNENMIPENNLFKGHLKTISVAKKKKNLFEKSCRFLTNDGIIMIIGPKTEALKENRFCLIHYTAKS